MRNIKYLNFLSIQVFKNIQSIDFIMFFYICAGGYHSCRPRIQRYSSIQNIQYIQIILKEGGLQNGKTSKNLDR